MRLLALETSTDAGTCALWQDGAITEKTCPKGPTQAETLLPLVRALLDEAGLAFRDLDAIAFAQGPGAFTGLRVACAAAQGMAIASGLPLVPVTTLRAMAATVDADFVLSLLDARMGEVYAACYARQGGLWVQQDEIRVSSPQDVVLPAIPGLLACGNALNAYPVLAERVAAAGLAALPGVLPTAASVAHLAAPAFLAGETLDAADVAPLYIRDKVAKTVAERLQEGGRA